MAIQATAVQVRHKELAEDERSWASQNFEAFIVRPSPRNLNRFFVAGPSRGPPLRGQLPHSLPRKLRLVRIVARRARNVAGGIR
jgi:hypothetical protein